MNTYHMPDDTPGESRGFSLLELLVVVSILVLVIGLSISSFNSFNRRERLKQASLNLKAAIRFAQTRAISADKPASCVASNASFVGMAINFTNNSYTVQHVCSDGVAGTDESVTLPPGISFVSVPSSFTYNALTRVTTLSAFQPILLTNSIETYKLQVETNGQVNDLNFQ